jgi:glycosyltransferase involved in cell wall biosynthesis
MKIIIDFRKYDGVVGGVEQGVIQITRYLTVNGHTVIVMCKLKRLDEVRGLFSTSKNINIEPLDVDTHVINKTNRMIDSVIIPEIAKKENAEIIHFPYNWSFPVNKAVPTILTVHDVIPFTFREAQSLFFNVFKYKKGIREACRLNDIIVTVSEFSKQDIAKKVGVPLQKIRVIYNGLREPNPHDNKVENNLRQRYSLNDRFILNVGGIHERKNIVRLIHAFALLIDKTGYSGKLVVTGKASGGPYQEKMKERCDRAISETGIDGRVVFTDYIPEKEIDELFLMADLLIYPSLYEGFGIPVVEAMKVHLPVITSNITALPEVAGGAALLADPEDCSDMAYKMTELLDKDDLRHELIEKGIENSKKFTWDKTSEEYLDLYHQLAKN